MGKQVRIVVRGRVQRVSFRAYAEREAKRLGLTGFVRNLTNGDVEVVAEGPESAIRSMVAWARTGSPAARVTEVVTEYSEAADGFAGFQVLYG